MKVLACVIVALALGTVHGRASWHGDLVQSFTNTSDRFTEYIRSTGRRIGKFVDTQQSNLKASLQNLVKRTLYTPKEIEKTVDSGKDQIEIAMTTPQMIAKYHYPAESHTIQTDDGYILTVHRIPHSLHYTSMPKKTVLLHHGLLGSSADWVLSGPEHSLAYLLSDVGYDVWMANARGNTYSKAHATFKTDSPQFWNFSWHEIGQHDLPAVIDYIHLLKGKETKINYIGHSMGTTALFVLLSTLPEYNERLRAGFALAPVAYMSDVKSPVRLFAPFANDIAKLTNLLGANEFLPHNWVIEWLAKNTCDIGKFERTICENAIFVICGHDKNQFNRSLLPAILDHDPAGASTKSLVHYAQEIHSGGSFQQFDYGMEGNLIHYGSKTPPVYPISRISLPIGFISAKKDWLAGEVDVSILYSLLPSKLEHYIVPLEDFSHIDFLWAIDAPKLVYKKLLNMMSTMDMRYDATLSRTYPALGLQWVGLE